jgi:hypothetical protein
MRRKKMFNEDYNKKDTVEQIIELLKELEWNIAYQLDLNDKNKIKGIICGDDKFIEEVFNGISKVQGEDSIIDFEGDFNPTHKGNKEEMN